MWSGVDLFFVLSGLLIGGLLLDYRASPKYYSVFYARRLHRIFPIYYLMIAVLLIGVWAFPHFPLFVGTMPLWVFPLFAQNLTGDFTRAPLWLGVTWSLAVEEQFYLVFPVVVRLFSTKTLLRIMLVCVVAAPLLRTALILNGYGFEQVYPLLPGRTDALALGVIAAIILRTESAKEWIREHSKLLYLSLFVLAAALGTMLKWTAYAYVGTAGYSLFGITYFVLILALLIAPLPFLKPIFTYAPLRWLGTVSYCVYLIHEPVRFGVFRLLGIEGYPAIKDPASLMATVLSLALTFAIAQLSWQVLEKRLVERAHLRYRY
jgi:peptidoglycan/LPS O-acetylase OafA/YrhL